MAATGALPQTLQSITDIKIGELSKQRDLFKKQHSEILRAAGDAVDLRSKARVLLEGVTRLKGSPSDAFDKEDLDLDAAGVEDGSERAAHVNIRRFLLQSRYDPSVSDRSLQEWVDDLERELQYLQLRHEHASFYSTLVTEWLASLEDDRTGTTEEEDGEAVGRAEMHEQRETWENLVFTAGDVQRDGIQSYLDRLFMRTDLSQQALKELREKIKAFGEELASKQTWFDANGLQGVSRALLRADLLSKEKTAILKEFMRNSAVAQEVADVLNMRLAALESWQWPAEGIPVEMRRHLNGKYRIFMDEDLLDALLLQYLGMQWAVTFRSAFSAFQESRAWKVRRPYIPKRVRRQFKHFREANGRTLWSGTRSVVAERQKTYEKNYFMTQLPSSLDLDAPGYGDDSDDGVVVEEQKRQTALEAKHSLLHLLITESLLYTTQHGEFTALRSDFQWFGPSLPHPTMLTVLAYFGVPSPWLRFFETFLQAPLRFTQDGPDAAVRIRQRGIPMSHMLSDCFGEVVLFCMDYAVNTRTHGAYLYRLHDDFWFWGHEKTCVHAWTTMTEFARVMGLEFNAEKTGTVRFASEKKQKKEETEEEDEDTPNPDHPPSPDIPLPTGDIRWGFLKLDAQEGRFVIDQEQVDQHIVELRRQMSACTSVFAWVQAWNSYFGRFFANNFGKPAVCFGREHIDMAIATLSRIERALFPDCTSGATDHLRRRIADRFDRHDLPEGFFYFPVEFGGLELLNPYIPLLAMREDIRQTPQGRLRRARLDDEKEYQAAKEHFEQAEVESPEASQRDGPVDADESVAFLSLDEYTRYAESLSVPLLQAYRDLTRVPDEVGVNQTQRLRAHQMSLADATCGPVSQSFDEMTPYWRWTAELYQGEMVRRYGGLAAVNREFMPLGVVKTLKEGKMRWQG
ncbi:uncharacterized protein ATNIH1004_000686 [Aspergillus tanneri]|uniref:Reverse transcriptase domain-containing protein n=1 Tax=Aspergillus tanneri TaxID=1220188 RepID=A0A5M9N2B1_9EURO|nr:uncharacterized protein ATNIH1004_000686 [Aspergillus tanneri]KAA8651790.1 hypothetical protein ATNIH1004_000686 [Aspergillus tanneri]